MPSSHLRDASEANRCVRNYQKHPVSRFENWNFAYDINSASLHGNHSPSSAWKITPLTEYPYLNHKVFVRFKLQRISVWRTRRVLLHKFSINERVCTNIYFENNKWAVFYFESSTCILTDSSWMAERIDRMNSSLIPRFPAASIREAIMSP